MSDAARVQELKERYGADTIDNLLRLRPNDYEALVGWRDELDPHYAKAWLDFTFGGMFKRGILDERTRLLIVVGQCTVLGETEELEPQIHSALRQGATPREVFEVIIQATTYAGYLKVNRAARVFRKAIAELGRLDEITGTQMPIGGRHAERSLERERQTWHLAEGDFPNLEAMLEKYGWEGISTGLRLQRGHLARMVQRLDALDQNYLKMWLDFIHKGMYSRGVLDDKTRLLVMVGNCLAMDEEIQGENHMRCALFLGATPREIFEVILQTTLYIGMPKCIKRIWVLERILQEHGRLGEITETQLPLW